MRAKHAELSGDLIAAQKRREKIRDDLNAVDRTLRVFDSRQHPEKIRPITFSASRRESTPLGTPSYYGRADPVEHVMMWQFYSSMSDDDAYSLADYLKSLRYQSHDVGERLRLFGADWSAAFKQVFGQAPSAADGQLYGK